jgi:glycine/D-amino acid oxidase-like deaminating enzyme
MQRYGCSILGAGPTGLGATLQLHKSGHTDWVLLDANPHPGGLASSYVTGQASPGTSAETRPILTLRLFRRGHARVPGRGWRKP